MLVKKAMTLVHFCFGAHLNQQVEIPCRNAFDKEAA